MGVCAVGEVEREGGGEGGRETILCHQVWGREYAHINDLWHPRAVLFCVHGLVRALMMQ